MLVVQCVALVCALAATSYAATNPSLSSAAHIDPTAMLHKMQAELDSFKTAVKQSISGLARQVMLQQLFVEERVRSDGGSGIKQIRGSAGGTKPYHFSTISAGAVNAIHEHSNYDRTIGMGEFIGVLNGVEFRTRHNDYRMVMPSKTKSDYNAVEDVPFPPVPASVTNKKTVAEQVVEMQQYFKAFHEQDTKIRDWRPYFKPVMCYLEGGWTTSTRTLSEPFESDRHFLDADSWFDLQEKVRYTSNSGGKSQFENYSYLPTTIMNVTDDGVVEYAQWNYRIVCHPVKAPLKLSDLQVVDDLAARMLLNRNYTQLAHSKVARFSIAPYDSDSYNEDTESGHFNDRRYLHGRLDDIMYEIPGKENYRGHLTDEAFDMIKVRVDTKNVTNLDVAKYHRHYKVLKKGAMGLTLRNRGFSDPYLFVAKTENPKIAKLTVEDCQNINGHRVCKNYDARHTYAVPLEMIWLTPLSAWNPYNLHHWDRQNKIPIANGRNGGFTTAKAYNGTSRGSYYLTPVEFYHGGETARDPADTAKDAVGVLDTHGNVHRTTAAGIRIFTPEIPGVGTVRLRYPIMPIHQEGNLVYKNLIALQDLTMNMPKYSRLFEVPPTFGPGPDARPADVHYRTSTTHSNPPGTHYHDVYLTPEEMKKIAHFGNTLTIYSTEESGHTHELVVKMDPAHHNFSRLLIVTCDGKATCWDHHNHYLYVQRD